MPILTIITAIWAHPIETIETFLDSIDEITASNDRIGYFSEFGTWVRIKINGHRALIFQRKIMTKLAFLALFTDTSLEIRAQSSLFVDYKTKIVKVTKFTLALEDLAHICLLAHLGKWIDLLV